MRPHVAVERHVLDESHIDRAVSGHFHKVADFVIIYASHHHNIDLQQE